MAENDAAREARIAKQRAEEAEREAQHQAEIDARLEPVKQRERRRWLYDHPDRTETDFEKKAWPLLRQNLIEEDEEQAKRELMDRLRRSSRYSL